MRKISFLFVIITSITFGQKKGHNPNDVIKEVYFNTDFTKFMTKSNTDIGLWDAKTKQAIWVFEATQFGCNFDGFYYVKTSSDLNYFSLANSFSCKKLVNSKTLFYEDYNDTNKSKLGVEEDNLIKDYQIDYEFKGNNQIAYLTDAKGKKKQIYKAKKYSYGCSVYENQVFVNIGTKIERYDIPSEKWEDIPFVTKCNDRVHLFNNILYCNYQQYNLATNTVKPFKLYSPASYMNYGNNLFWMKNLENKFFLFNLETEIESEIELHHKNDLKNDIKFVSYDSKQKKIYFIENDKELINNDFLYKFYLTAYSSETGNYVESISLTNSTLENVMALRKESAAAIEKRDQEVAEQYTPEKLLQRKLNNIQGNYIYNTTTKGIYYIVPGKPIYENHLVRLDAVYNDKKLNSEVYETMEKLEDSNVYRRAKGHSACGVCGGNGYTVTSGKATIADYEYTTGKKLVQTTTTKSGCNQCGGCGLVPTTLVDLNFLFIN